MEKFAPLFVFYSCGCSLAIFILVIEIVFVRQSANPQKLMTSLPKTNLWHVSDVSEFQKYCCPECQFKCEQFNDLRNHAIETHELSKTFSFLNAK